MTWPRVVCVVACLSAIAAPAQAPPARECRPLTARLLGDISSGILGVAVRICRDGAGTTEMLAEVIGDTASNTTAPVRTGRIVFSAHDTAHASWRFVVDGVARRAFVTRRIPGGEPVTVRADSAPWRASVLSSSGNLWRVHAAWSAALSIDSVEYISASGARWRRADVEMLARTTQPTVSTSGRSEPGVRGKGWSLLGVANLATPAPHAPRPGARASVGAIATHSARGREFTVGIAPPRPVFEWAPIQANPNQRGRRILPDGRPEMTPWRAERGHFIWLDTRRIDRGLGFVHLAGDESPVGALVTVAENGAVSAAALRVGTYDTGPLALRLAATREAPPPGGYRARHPWLLIGGLSGGVRGGDSSERDASPRPWELHWEWNATAPAGSPDLRRGAALVSAIVPLGNALVIASHERLAPGFGSKGAAFAPLDGIEVSDITLLTGAGRSRIEVGVDLLAPFRGADPLSGAPFADASREMRGRARWHSPVASAGELVLQATVASYRYREEELGPWPGGSATFTTASGRDWRWQLHAHAERTPLFALLAPARAGGVRLSAERRAERHATMFFVAAERVDVCGSPIAAASRSGAGLFAPSAGATRDAGSGCGAAGDALAFSALHARSVTKRTRLEVEGRWQRHRAVVGDAPPSLNGPRRLEWRAALTSPMPAGAVLSSSAQCGLEQPRATCDMSLVITRSLARRREP